MGRAIAFVFVLSIVLSKEGLEQLDLECTRIVNQCWVDSDKDPERAADLLSQTLMELSPTMPEPDITGTQFEELLAKLHVPK
jgi:hypothetical protein